MLQAHNFNAPCQSLREIIMSNDMLTKMSEQYQTLLDPVIKANKLSAANLEALVNFQMNSLQSYVDMAMARMKAAAEINDPASLQTFLTSQAETITSLNQKFMDDTKALSDLMGRFKTEFDKLVKDSLPTGK
jgi:phasin family protein